MRHRKHKSADSRRRVVYHVAALTPEQLRRLKYYSLKIKWQVKREGATRYARTVATKVQAVDWAKRLAKRHALGKVVVHGQDGKIQDVLTYGRR